MDHMRKGTDPGNWKNLVEEHSCLATQENFTLSKEWHLNKSSSMPLPREARQEYSLEPGTQYLLPVSYHQAAPRGITEKYVSVHQIEACLDSQIPSTLKVDHHLERSQQARHSNIVQTHTALNLDASTLYSPIGEEHNVPLQPNRLIPEY